MLCIGHRGAMGHEPENTLSSIRKALELGAPFVEVDVYSVDGELIVFHDDRLERTTNGSGYVLDQTFEHLRTLDAGNGQLIPTLKEVCDEVDRRAGINIELKGPATAVPVVELIRDLERENWDLNSVLVSSFNHRELAETKRLDPRIQIGALICGLPVDDSKFAADLGAISVHPALEFVDQRFIDDAHARELRVYVYTVDHPEDIQRMRNLGVDGVFTNFPELVLEDCDEEELRTSWK